MRNGRTTLLQNNILSQEKRTLRYHSWEYVNSKEKGIFKCVCCGNVLFKSDDKLILVQDGLALQNQLMTPTQQNMTTTVISCIESEVTCNKCGAHLAMYSMTGQDQQE